MKNKRLQSHQQRKIYGEKSTHTHIYLAVIEYIESNAMRCLKKGVRKRSM